MEEGAAATIADDGVEGDVFGEREFFESDDAAAFWGEAADGVGGFAGDFVEVAIGIAAAGVECGVQQVDGEAFGEFDEVLDEHGGAEVGHGAAAVWDGHEDDA